MRTLQEVSEDGCVGTKRISRGAGWGRGANSADRGEGVGRGAGTREVDDGAPCGGGRRRCVQAPADRLDFAEGEDVVGKIEASVAEAAEGSICSRCVGDSGVSRTRRSSRRMRLIGVRIAWLIVARKSLGPSWPRGRAGWLPAVRFRGFRGGQLPPAGCERAVRRTPWRGRAIRRGRRFHGRGKWSGGAHGVAGGWPRPCTRGATGTAPRRSDLRRSRSARDAALTGTRRRKKYARLAAITGTRSRAAPVVRAESPSAVSRR